MHAGLAVSLGLVDVLFEDLSQIRHDLFYFGAVRFLLHNLFKRLDQLLVDLNSFGVKHGFSVGLLLKVDVADHMLHYFVFAHAFGPKVVEDFVELLLKV